MNIKKHILIIVLTFFSAVCDAATTMQSMPINNRSSQTIYVWVTAAVNVVGPISGRPPYLAMAIKPHSGNVRLNYTYTDTWNGQTIFSLAFCKENKKGCFSASGQYSALTMVPVSEVKTKWRITGGESSAGEILLPSPPVWDNVASLQGTTWDRDSDFPDEVTFTDRKGS